VIVADASAITELLLQTELGTRVEERLFRDDEDIHAPHLLDVEVLSALRRLVREGEVLAGRAQEAIEDLALLRIIRVWDLHENFTAYDAVYLTLAESLDGTVITCDAPFGSAPGHSTRIEVIR
jgi:predicted nucleic acid-binding protein